MAKLLVEKKVAYSEAGNSIDSLRKLQIVHHCLQVQATYVTYRALSRMKSPLFSLL